ncbi:MAG: nucleotidyltransferase domain-containing protein [Candidatus Aenigmarchaeota archaeon]|nr:nucleotidyltransferase domain-containing protein [Candidatus Aenigmarchaeota archaeon]
MVFEKLEQDLEDTELVKKENKDNTINSANKETIEKAVAFTNSLRKQYGELVKSVLIFGSSVKGTMVKGSDIDMWVILDDTATKASQDINRIIDHAHILAGEFKDMHLQIHTLTEFWQSIRIGSPEFSNFLRYGLAIYDTGFIKPIQRMLQMGLIPPSDETISLKARSSITRFRKIKQEVKLLIFDLRYTMLDMVQAVIMHYYKETPDYKKAPEFLEKLVKQKKLEKKYVDLFVKLDKLWKDIDHNEIKNVTTDHLNEAIETTEEMIERMKKLLPKDFVGEEMPKEG